MEYDILGTEFFPKQDHNKRYSFYDRITIPVYIRENLGKRGGK